MSSNTDTPTAPTMTELAQMSPTERYNVQARAFGEKEHMPTVTNGPPQFELAHAPGTPEAIKASENLTRTVEAANRAYASKVAEINNAFNGGTRSENAKQVRDKALLEVRATWQASLKSTYATISKEAAPPSTTSKTPPSPQELEAQNRRLADFDKEMVKAGLQKEPPAEPVNVGKILATLPTVPADQVDQRALSTLNQLWAGMSPAERVAKRETYEHDIASIYAGRRPLEESMAAFIARKTEQPVKPTEQPRGADGKFQSSQYTPEQTETALAVAAKASNAEGWARAEAITGPLLHGYRIPQDREYHVAELVAGLRLARAGNLTQQQVDAIIAKGGA